MQQPPKNHYQIQPQTQALLFNKHVRNTALVAAAIKHVGESYKFNAWWFEDFASFNFFNGQKYQKPEKVFVSPGNLPTKVREKVMKLYGKLRKYSIDKIFIKLNIPKTATNKSSPLETKWAFEYYKKFQTWEYSSTNKISSNEILRSLSTLEAKEYSNIF